MIVNVMRAFGDRIKFKAFVLSAIAYLVLSNGLFAIVVHFWIPPGVPIERLQRLVEIDETLLMWQSILGLFLASLSDTSRPELVGGKG